MDARVWRIDEAADVLLAHLVGEVYGVAAECVEIVREPRGNPCAVISAEVGVASRIECSLASSHPWVAAAVLGPGEDGWVGIDVEDAHALSVAPADFMHILGPAETPDYARLVDTGSGNDLGDALLRAWVRKEAVMKALHTGLATDAGGLAPEQVECGPPTQARCTSHPWVELTDLGESEGYVAALAYNPYAHNPYSVA